MWRRPFLIMFLAALAALPALALARPFPANAKRGTMTPAPYPNISIDGETRRLAPGARIWNEKNLIQLPAYLQGSDLPVNYTEDNQGDINRVWILSPTEADVPISAQTNSTSR